MANVTVRQQAGGPDFLPIYVSPGFRYIFIFELNGSKTFITTQCTISNHFLWPSLPLGGLKIWSKGSFWLVSILSPVENSKQNKSKNVLSYDIMSFHWPLSIPQYTQKISTHYLCKWRAILNARWAGLLKLSELLLGNRSSKNKVYEFNDTKPEQWAIERKGKED